MTPSPELVILRHLAVCTHASAAEIGIGCRMTAAEVRARLAIVTVGVSRRQGEPWSEAI